MQELIRIDGREFQGVNQELSAAQDDYLVGQLRDAGAAGALLNAADHPEAQAEQLLTRIMVSGRASQVLAGCLTEVGKTWNYAEATRNAERFAAVTNPQEKAAMRGAIVGFVLGFFQYARASARTFPKFSNQS